MAITARDSLSLQTQAFKDSEVVAASATQYELTVSQRCLSASAGAVVTSLMMTPLDVAKVRLQAQMPTMQIAPNTTTVNYCKCAYFEYCNGLMEHMLPKENRQCRFLFESASPSVAYRGTIHALRSILKKEGVAALWSGLQPTLWLAVPSTVFYFTSYDALHDMMTEREVNATAVPLISGMLARTLAVSVVSPLEMLRTRMQSNGGQGAFAEVIAETRSLGVRSLWRGVHATLMRDVPFSMIYWGVLESVRDRVEAANLNLSRPETSFIAGGVAGSVAAIVTNPFDVIKTRQQVYRYSANGNRNISMVTVARQLLSEGISTGFSGLGARLAKVAPACAIMISSYELGKSYFGSR